ncbi:glycosyltransferase family 2 protein [Hyphococcus flavus]|uniref:Glycosyltransferase family 2 protein n=1 Tax=Hyphococcus flavus TaxID=1866326 RepID=A0AAE9ZI71_9PROT|nr:glycosyltransferase family 2 protein [Hyphococcus flavus]WDI33127.1 glycosyltransferase family 2 protein [Hyphococcus flavus]
MTKLIIQIPCLNESETIAGTIDDLPKAIDGIDEIEILIIDDGSTDDTAAAAKAAGAHHVISSGVNRGLAQSFQRGLDACLRRGADIIVNTDGDNQYNGADVTALVRPILSGRADVVVGDRQTEKIAHFSPLKKKLQRAGSALVSQLANAEIADAVSGFRALSREAAMGMTVRSSFSYTTETLIQAGRRRLRIASVPIRTNKVERPSRLFRSIPQFLTRTGRTMLRAYAMYEPLKIFALAGLVLMALGAIPVGRFLLHYFMGDGAGMIQSLIIGAVLMLMGAISAMFALIADLVAYNRQLLELTLERVRKIEYAMDQAPVQKKRIPVEKIREELKSLPQVFGGGLR